jgi:hypothetical protein
VNAQAEASPTTTLPRTDDGKMAKVVIAFDVDGTLIRNSEGERQHGVPNNNDVPIVHQINTLQVLSTYKNVRIVVWSGGGKKYAEMWGARLGLDKYVWKYASKLEHEQIKAQCDFLIAIDDIQATALGDVNLIVKEK